MRNIDIIPQNIESPFEKDEMFFSTTNPKGKILSGNQIFIRTSKYKEEEIINQPHNIVRHPDMPKIIFKLLWDYIQAGKPIVAYVKNMAKDGSYYWVLATVLPIFDEEGNILKYLSIRIKPETEYFKIAKKLYKKLKEIEEIDGIEASYEYLIKELNKLGFKDYDAFMKKILESELKLKEEVLNTNLEEKSQFSQKMKEIYNIFLSFKEIQTIYKEIYKFTEDFLKAGEFLKENSESIFSLSDDIRLISLNSSVESYKLGANGNSFFVLSTEMRKTAEKSGKAVRNMESLINKALSSIEDIVFSMSISKLGIFMINKFLEEVLCDKCTEKDISDQIIRDLCDNQTVIRTQLLNINSISKSLNDSFRKILDYLNTIRYLIKRLNFLYLSGMVESAHQTKTNFSIIFIQINELVSCTKKTIDQLSSNLSSIYEGNRIVKKDIEEVLEIMNEIEQTLQRFSIPSAIG
ncbi:MAG: PAS domain-containing protein [Aquificae bacterium]|nr:PAS domain-containing protein [Aquificota bacterium]